MRRGQDLDLTMELDLDPPSSPPPNAAPRELFSCQSPAGKGRRSGMAAASTGPAGVVAVVIDTISDPDDDVKVLDNSGPLPSAPPATKLPPLPRVGLIAGLGSDLCPSGIWITFA